MNFFVILRTFPKMERRRWKLHWWKDNIITKNKCIKISKKQTGSDIGKGHVHLCHVITPTQPEIRPVTPESYVALCHVCISLCTYSHRTGSETSYSEEFMFPCVVYVSRNVLTPTKPEVRADTRERSSSLVSCMYLAMYLPPQNRK